MLLRELFDLERLKASGTDLPPVADEDRGGGGDRSGMYWIKGSTKVPVVKNQYGGYDWCTTVYETPEKFGFTKESLLKVVREMDEFTASVIERNLPPNHLGGRATGESILLQRGWAYVEYNIPDVFKVRAGKGHVKEVIENLADKYPILQVEEIILYTINITNPSNWDAGRVSTRRFYREDHGFGGHFADLLKASSGESKQTYWYYKKVSDPRHGIPAEHGYVQHGYASYKDKYFMTFLDETFGRHLRDRSGWVRFPSSLFQGSQFKNTVHEIRRELMFYSDTFFRVPPDQIQVWNGTRWVFLSNK